MKFCYCPECKDLRPTSWYRRKNCMLCGKECRIVTIPMSIYGYLMYALSAVAAILVAMEIMEVDLGIGETRIYIIFGSLLLAFVFSFLEINRATQIAQERIGRVL
jgi:hypothetical protein